MAPPRARAPIARPSPIADAARAAIAASGLSLHALAQTAGVSPSAVWKFAHGEDLKLSTLDALAGPLGLALVKPAARGRKPRPRP